MTMVENMDVRLKKSTKLIESSYRVGTRLPRRFTFSRAFRKINYVT